MYCPMYIEREREGWMAGGWCPFSFGPNAKRENTKIPRIQNFTGGAERIPFSDGWRNVFASLRRNP